MYSDEFRGRFPVCPGERLNGIQEVIGSIPTVSTNDKKDRELSVLCPFLCIKIQIIISEARQCGGGVHCSIGIAMVSENRLFSAS